MRTLGATGITVSRFALGTMHLGAWGNADHSDAARVVNAALPVDADAPPTNATRYASIGRSSVCAP
jgi:hypothetical protein